MRRRTRARTLALSRSNHRAHGLRLVLLAIVTAIALWMLIAPSPAGATTVLHFTDAELAERSDLVVLASVVEQSSFRHEDSGQIYTVTTLEIEETLAGRVQAGDRLVVRQLGGTVGEETRYIPGDARLDVGERSVFFLADREPDSGVVFLTSFAQSVLEVVGETHDGDLLLTRDNGGLTFYDATAPEPLEIAKDDPSETLTLDALREVVEEAAR